MNTRRFAGIAALGVAAASILVIPDAGADELSYTATSDAQALGLSVFGQGLTLARPTARSAPHRRRRPTAPASPTRSARSASARPRSRAPTPPTAPPTRRARAICRSPSRSTSSGSSSRAAASLAAVDRRGARLGRHRPGRYRHRRPDRAAGRHSARRGHHPGPRWRRSAHRRPRPAPRPDRREHRPQGRRAHQRCHRLAQPGSAVHAHPRHQLGRHRAHPRGRRLPAAPHPVAGSTSSTSPPSAPSIRLPSSR